MVSYNSICVIVYNICIHVLFVLSRNHIANMFEHDRHFSHLSTLERELSFRTEMVMIHLSVYMFLCMLYLTDNKPVYTIWKLWNLKITLSFSGKSQISFRSC